METEKFSRSEKLLILASFDYEAAINTGSGHNTAWVERIDLILEGRRGLYDYTDEELQCELDELVGSAEADPDFPQTNEGLLKLAKEMSGIAEVYADKKVWKGREQG